MGLVLARLYIWPSGPRVATVRERPWRRLGAGISLVLAVMFTAGVYFLGDNRPPKVYAWYWSVIMVLVLWLFVLAVRDMSHTRAKILEKRRAARRNGRGSARQVESPEQPHDPRIDS